MNLPPANFLYMITIAQSYKNSHNSIIVLFKCFLTFQIWTVAESTILLLSRHVEKFYWESIFDLETEMHTAVPLPSQYISLHYTVPLDGYILHLLTLCFCMKVALIQREYIIFVLLALTYFSENKHLLFGPLGCK